MLLSLPVLRYARVNTHLLQHNKPALFIPSPAYKLAGAVKLFFFNTHYILGLPGYIINHYFAAFAYYPDFPLVSIQPYRANDEDGTFSRS